MKSAIVLLSGGLDSAITAAYLYEQSKSLKACVFVDRGQSNFAQESHAAKRIADYLQIPLLRATFSIPDLKSILEKHLVRKICKSDHTKLCLTF